MKILVLEDDLLFANNMRVLLQKLEYELIDIVDNAEDMMRLFLATNPDIVLLDIEVKGEKNGIDIAKEINESKNPVPIIFVTAYQENDVFEQAKESKPFAYIIKPFHELTLQRSIELAIHQYNDAHWDYEQLGWKQDIVAKDSFFVKDGKKLHKINIKDILCIEVGGRNCKITVTNRHFFIKISLKEISANLDSNTFLQIHRNYIINTEKIENIDLEEYTITVGNKAIPLSKRYKDSLLKRLKLL